MCTQNKNLKKKKCQREWLELIKEEKCEMKKSKRKIKR